MPNAAAKFRQNYAGENMSETTCAACDCRIEGAAIQVSVGGKTVEVCCDECATALREAQAATSHSERRVDRE
jgi:hypothetical protein